MTHFIIKPTENGAGKLYLRIEKRLEPSECAAVERPTLSSARSYWEADLACITPCAPAAPTAATAENSREDIARIFTAVLNRASAADASCQDGLRQLTATTAVKISNKHTGGGCRRKIEIVVVDQCHNAIGRVICENSYAVDAEEIFTSAARAAGICADPAPGIAVTGEDIEELREGLRLARVAITDLRAENARLEERLKACEANHEETRGWMVDIAYILTDSQTPNAGAYGFALKFARPENAFEESIIAAVRDRGAHDVSFARIAGGALVTSKLDDEHQKDKRGQQRSILLHEKFAINKSVMACTSFPNGKLGKNQYIDWSTAKPFAAKTNLGECFQL